ncbi:serine hydrolase domain-containing protein [Nocardioides xinjiangensis]|uniref:serine hydrolase domain-containing protein n=1 Tax=Nocardioides xinjiangensis TaxID=2817376 RepID=UPI001B3161D2|nr:serine hydrolase domain-containing protein [Nocardioides sp. SYSU D00514]
MELDPAAALDALVASGRDPGCAVAVVRDGIVEVDHAAGTSDGSRAWSSDTLVMTYSVAKPFAALTVLDAVSEGAFALDDPVVAWWPEYGAAGKAGTTIRHLLLHQAGLPAFGPEADEVAYDDREALVGLLARATPVHEPGTGVAEHALTYGHLLDEVLRRATGEELAERFGRIAAAAGWDLHLRVADDDLDRVATVEEVLPTWRSDYVRDPRWGPALGRPRGLLDPQVLNSSRFRRTSFPAIALHASALGLARCYDDVARPDGLVAQRLGPELWRAYLGPAATGHDLVLDRDVVWTLGFQRDEEDGRLEIGMGGAGGCSAWTEPAAGYGAAFVTRGLGGHDRGDDVWRAVRSSMEPSTGDAGAST